MKKFDFEAGKRFRKEGEIVEALRCFRAALDEDRDSVETYLELAATYILAFEGSGDPLCLDSARKVCLAGLKRDPSEKQRLHLLGIQDRIEDLILDSEKAEADAMSDAMDAGAVSIPEPGPGDLSSDAALEDDELEGPDEERGH
ncbi:MAG: hypothetical protein HY049_14830 [Acidobacteria bacterium]|nr:hypothetical protein [Acidobacteriota bacterium]